MTYATITIAVLAFVLATAIIRLWCLEDTLAHMERHCKALTHIAHEVCDKRDQALQELAWQHERAGAYLREATLLVAENERLKRGEWTDDDAIVEDVERWLEALP